MSTTRTKTNIITEMKNPDKELTRAQKEICKHFKIYQSDVYARICKQHETFEQALSHCINKTIIVFKNTNLEFIGTKARICKYFRVSQKNISLRMKNKNETFEEAIKYYLNENVENTNNNNE